MKDTDIATARLNIKISINRLLFRSALERVSEEKQKVILREANDVNYSLEVLRMLEDDNESFEKLNNSLRLEILYLKKELIKQQEIHGV
jgi:nicotinamide mononucleotide adenylyltransferase